MSSEKKEIGEYYLGLDIGTDSLGWCVTDPNYKVLKFHGNAMWGVRLFDAAISAEGRRGFRTARRRLHRRNQRVKLVQDLLRAEVNKVDPLFFRRLKQSNFHLEDKKPEIRQRYTLFADKLYTDKKYHREFPTIYHLRCALMEHKKKYDIRLYYLAISHFMKHRGHFLFDGEFSEKPDFEKVFHELREYVSDQMEFSLDTEDLTAVKTLLCDRKISRNDKKREIIRLFTFSSSSNQRGKKALEAICGSTVQIADLYDDDSLKELKFFSFPSLNDEKIEELSSALGERFEYIRKLKTIYDWTVLEAIMGDHKSISHAQVARFEKHRNDLIDLKAVFRYCFPEEYDAFFFGKDDGKGREYKRKTIGYDAYSGRRLFSDVDTWKWKTRPEQSEFCEGIEKKLGKVDAIADPRLNETLERIKSEAEERVFMPKPVSKGNSVIPYQIHRKDLCAILKALGEDYPALTEKDADSLSVCDKLLMLFEFRIPYYVGPLNPLLGNGGNCWVERKEEGRVLPWNFDSKVNREKTAEIFMERLTSKCTYLHDKAVLPKNSLLYSKVMVLNELNNVRIDGVKLPPEDKQRIFKELFETESGKITLKRLKDWIKKEKGRVIDDEQITGVDKPFQGTLKSYHDFVKILGGGKQGKARVEADPSMIETIIRDILIFGEDKETLCKRIERLYGDRLNSLEITNIAKLSYSGWGNLSLELLNGITGVDPNTGKSYTILEAMWEGQENLSELLLAEKYDYAEAIRTHNDIVDGTPTSLKYELVRGSYASPAVKRGVWQALLIVDELRKVLGADPARIFIEVAREKEKNQKRSFSRQEQLLNLYKNVHKNIDDYKELIDISKHEINDMIEEINNRDSREFNVDKLFLYFTQWGRDIYTGERIELEELFARSHGKEVFNIDHVIPQCRKKDDSVLNNLVLTNSISNGKKDNNYPIPEQIVNPEAKTLWKFLLKSKSITREKFDRLVRRGELSDDELAGFISRQLVETRQSTKVVADILKRTIPTAKIIYVKASHVSAFRNNEYNPFWKARSINDYHHAKDAYLNIVVGNVYFTRFTDNPSYFIRECHGHGYTLDTNDLLRVREKEGKEYRVERNGKVAWRAGEDGTIATVIDQMKKNNILFTRLATTKSSEYNNQLKRGFWTQQPNRKDDKLAPLKSGLESGKYGGYSKVAVSHFMLVESKRGRRIIRTLEAIPRYLSRASKEIQLDYLVKNELGPHLKEPIVLISKIKIDSLLKIDGVPMHLTGKKDDTYILVKNAVQLRVLPDEERFFHKLEKFMKRFDEAKKNGEKITINPRYDGLSAEDLLTHFELLEKKASEKVYQERLRSQIDKIRSIKSSFPRESLEKQCQILSDILELFHCKGGKAGIDPKSEFYISKTISSKESARLICQSVTGLFETEVDLLRVGK